MHLYFEYVPVFLGVMLLFSSVTSVLVKRRVHVYGGETVTQISLDEYTLIGDDFPAYYPIDLSYVSLTPENTIHYQIYTTDADSEWASIFPDGGGFMYLGEDKRPYGLALFHQLHCLVQIREAMNSRTSTEHVHHCFNYLRQSILCDANPTIEPVIPIVGRRSVNAELPRICKDWTELYRIAEESYHSINITSKPLYV